MLGHFCFVFDLVIWTRFTFLMASDQVVTTEVWIVTATIAVISPELATNIALVLKDQRFRIFLNDIGVLSSGTKINHGLQKEFARVVMPFFAVMLQMWTQPKDDSSSFLLLLIGENQNPWMIVFTVLSIRIMP